MVDPVQAVALENVVWRPQPGPQTAFLACPCFEVFYGGARGGGKTDAVLGEFAAHAGRYGAKARGIVIRREAKQLEDMIRRGHEIYGRLGWTWNGSSLVYRSPEGATLRFRHLWDVAAAGNYQGHSYTRLYAEELTEWPNEEPIKRMRATLRSADGVPVGFRATGNPGGVGHNWVRARYIEPAPPYTPIRDSKTGTDRVFIPARLEDNPALVSSDASYEARLMDSGPEQLVRAWRWGDWDIVAGGALDDVWGPHPPVVSPFEIPKGWTIDRSFDWGSSKPFSVGWWAEADGSETPNGLRTIKGDLFQVAELYGWNGKDNEGLRLSSPEIARRILEAEKAMGIAGRVQPGPADSAIFATEDGHSIADEMARVGVRWLECEKGPGSRVAGLDQVRKRIKASKASPREEPGIFFFDTCRHSLRTLPVIPRDDRKPDDVDTDAEDHAYDMVRYRVMKPRPKRWAGETERPW